jgi:very-short-patch-repair endonuclease
MASELGAVIAGLQDGLITRRQAEAVGLTSAAIRYALRPGGSWQRVLRGVYATFTGPLADVHRWRAAVLHAGPTAVITGATACAMVGLRYAPEATQDVDVLVPSGRRCSSLSFVQVHRTGRLPDPPHYWLDEQLAIGGPPVWADAERPAGWVEIDRLTGGARPGMLPVAPAARAVVDACRLLAKEWAESGPAGAARLLRETRAAMCEVVQDRRRGVRVAELAAEVAASPRQFSAQLHTAIADIVAGCRSAPECELRDLVRATRGLPEPRWNRPLPGDSTLTPDACWPEARLVVEVDSRAWHGFGDAPERTERRRARYAALGWTVLPVGPSRLRSEPDAVRAEIVRAYAAGRALRRGVAAR